LKGKSSYDHSDEENKTIYDKSSQYRIFLGFGWGTLSFFLRDFFLLIPSSEDIFLCTARLFDFSFDFLRARLF
jgi:hypothetical protein